MRGVITRDGQELRQTGIPISPGLCYAPACLFDEVRHTDIERRTLPAEDVEKEVARLGEALTTAAGRVGQVRNRVAREVGRAEAEIFIAQEMILEDEGLRKKMTALIRGERAGAELAVMKIMDAYEARISALDDEYLRERASDVGEVKRRVLDVLQDTRPSLRCERHGRCQRGRNRVVVARELTPSLTVELDTQRVRGFVTGHGGMTSHAAILARAIGIPAVSGLPGLYEQLACGTEILVDGDSGEVVLWPSKETLDRVRDRLPRGEPTPDVVAPVREIAVLANINRAEDVEEAVRVQAEGIGLYRTEFECMAAGRFLGEEEQESRFRAILKAMAGRPVYVRLYDLGGDKRPDFLGLPVELNPSLGLRGARLLLARPDWVAAQARAVARASQHGPVHLTYPMITDAAQFLALRRLVEEAMAGIRTGTILHGAMFEVPGACLQAAEILGVADFGSIGTNDLYQYLFAVDRNSEYVSDDFRPDTPVFWSLIRGVLEAGVRERKPVSVCGEIAGWSKYVERLLGIGTHTVSVSTRVIGSVRRAAQSAGARREAQAHA